MKHWLVNNPNDPGTKHWSRNMRNYDFYFKEGITFTEIGARFSARLNGKGYIFDTNGPTIFGEELLIVCGFVNTSVFEYFNSILCKQITKTSDSINLVPFVMPKEPDYTTIEHLVIEAVSITKTNYNYLESSFEFAKNWMVVNGEKTIEKEVNLFVANISDQFNRMCEIQSRLNEIFIRIYGLDALIKQENQTKNVTLISQDKTSIVKSLLSYAVGCMLGRYSLDVPGLAYAGGDWDDSKYSTFIPDKDNVIPITDEQYFDDDIVGLFISWLKKVYGTDTLEENLDYIAKALGGKGRTSREIIRAYFLNEFFMDHCQTYSVTGSGKRPIYWLFDSGKQNGFKALVYMHRFTEDTIGKVRVDYLHRMEQIYSGEILRMRDMIDHSKSAHDVSVASKRVEKMKKQIKECHEYDEKLGHLALDRTTIDLDDGVKFNYRKVQTGRDGKFYEVLADSQTIMIKK